MDVRPARRELGVAERCRPSSSSAVVTPRSRWRRQRWLRPAEPGDGDALAQARFALGNALMRNGRPESRAMLEEVAASLDGLDDPRVALKALTNLAQLEFREGNLRQAALTADRLAAGALRFAWIEGEAMAAWTLADVHSALRQPEMAADDLRHAYDHLLQAANIPWAALSLGDLAAAELEAGHLDEAMRHHHDAVELGRDRLPTYWHMNLLTALVPGLLAAGRVAEAERLLPEPITFVAPSRVRLADAQVKLARGLLAAALAEATPLALRSEPAVEWQARTVAGKALQRLGRKAEAEIELRLAIDQLEAQRATLPAGALGRTTFFANKLEPYRELLEMLLDEHRPRDAFAIAERMKGQSLQEVLAQGQVDLSLTMAAEERTHERDLDGRLASLNRASLASSGKPDADLRRKLDDARHALERFRSELYLRHPQIVARRLRDRDPLAAAAGLLPAETAALEFVVLDRRTVGFLVQNRLGKVRVETYQVPIRRDELEQRVDSLTRALEQRDPGFSSVARSFYDLLVRPSRCASRCTAPDRRARRSAGACRCMRQTAAACC